MSALFGSKPKAPTIIPTPTVDDAESRRIQAASISEMQRRSGRSSTLLSRNQGAASSGGTTAYGNTKLGQS
ncbi:MAG: hypothetical protein DI589_12060 [Shinella sp.]|nr:MAG: hypothetical protein DI589_12060 [Shinella sp.]